MTTDLTDVFGGTTVPKLMTFLNATNVVAHKSPTDDNMKKVWEVFHMNEVHISDF